MKRFDFRKASYLVIVLIFGLMGTRCATPQKEIKTYPLTEINPEKVFQENRGLKVLRDNATMIHDNYRGGVQEKEEGETLMKAEKWNEARLHLEKSNRFLRVALKHLPGDDAYLNVYGEQTIIFLPNLLIADNDLKLAAVYKNLKNDDRAAQVRKEGQLYLAESLKSVKTEWANQIKKGFEN